MKDATDLISRASNHTRKTTAKTKDQNFLVNNFLAKATIKVLLENL